MNFKKTAITLLLVPSIVVTGLYGCSDNTESTNNQETTNQASAETLSKSYEDAKAKGFTGTEENWEKLLALYATDPKAAEDQASSFGMSEMILAGVAGAALGALMTNQINNNNLQRQAALAREEERRRTTTTGSGVVTTPRQSYNSSTANTKPSNSSVSLAKAPSTTSVARGGFGGAVSSGG